MKWVVGQEVYMLSGIYILKGKVVEVTPSGVVVEELPWPWIPDSKGGTIFHFDHNGNEPDVSHCNRLGFGPSPEDKFHTVLWCSAPEFQPWHLDDMPLAERTALIEKKSERKDLNEMDGWSRSSHAQR